MIIFHIPSWYPCPDKPFAGIFIKEQITAYAEFYPDDKCYVSNLHQLRYEIALRNPAVALASLLQFIKQKKTVLHNTFPNLIELQSKILVGNEIITGNYFKNMIRITESHLLTVIKKESKKPDLIHAHVCDPAGLIAEYLSDKYQIPYIISEHIGNSLVDSGFESHPYKEMILKAYHRAKAILSVSSFHKKLLENYGIGTSTIIPNLVDAKLFYPKSMQPKNKKFTFFTFSIIKESKGIRDLLLSISNVVKLNQNIIFLIGGDGAELKKYKSFAIELGIEQYVVWLGYLDRQQASNEFQNCDCFILPSKLESFGVVYAEAIACGKPIIATNCGGPADIVTEFNGIMVEVGNIDAIANAMLYMIEYNKDYNSEHIRQDFMERFSRKPIVQKLNEFYNEMLYIPNN